MKLLSFASKLSPKKAAPECSFGEKRTNRHVAGTSERRTKASGWVSGEEIKGG